MSDHVLPELIPNVTETCNFQATVIGIKTNPSPGTHHACRFLLVKGIWPSASAIMLKMSIAAILPCHAM